MIIMVRHCAMSPGARLSPSLWSANGLWAGCDRASKRKAKMMIDPMRRSILVPIHRAGWPFIATFAVASLLLSMFGRSRRDRPVRDPVVRLFLPRPERLTPARQGPDRQPRRWRVSAVSRTPPPMTWACRASRSTRISIVPRTCSMCMSTAFPSTEPSARSRYRPGKFLERRSRQGERGQRAQCRDDRHRRGAPIVVVQIAGLIARRINADRARASRSRAGQRIGLIRFGSRVDVYLPEGRPLPRGDRSAASAARR